MSAGRAGLVDAIIALLKASTKTNLAAVDDNAIQFGLRGWTELFAVDFRSGIYVALLAAPSDVLTMSGAKQDLKFTLQVTAYRVGYQPETDERTLLSLLEEIEEILWTDSNMRIDDCDFQGISRFEFYPPVGRREVTIHWAMMELQYNKTTNL